MGRGKRSAQEEQPIVKQFLHKQKGCFGFGVDNIDWQTSDAQLYTIMEDNTDCEVTLTVVGRIFHIDEQNKSPQKIFGLILALYSRKIVGGVIQEQVAFKDCLHQLCLERWVGSGLSIKTRELITLVILIHALSDPKLLHISHILYESWTAPGEEPGLIIIEGEEDCNDMEPAFHLLMVNTKSISASTKCPPMRTKGLKRFPTLRVRQSLLKNAIPSEKIQYCIYLTRSPVTTQSQYLTQSRVISHQLESGTFKKNEQLPIGTLQQLLRCSYNGERGMDWSNLPELCLKDLLETQPIYFNAGVAYYLLIVVDCLGKRFANQQQPNNGDVGEQING
ncbi:hypothetical protein MP228_012352 [Amoeboaphelidium protococcarum]|nr:hypothetical protein MP228_012352 [Amoeboaphelidium protococcarum]